jgi:recombinational DNA repair ATPase RecF
MFLKEITLINFKCHEKLWLNFACDNAKQPTRKTTFMLGENGTGKSALLKAIALITSGSSGLSDILGNPDDWIKTKNRSAKLRQLSLQLKEKNEIFGLK